MASRPMTTEEQRAASAGAYHEFRPSLVDDGCARCARDRKHPSHGPKLPPLNCPCGTTVERHEVGAHLRGHGLFACGLDPWKMTDASLAEVFAFVKRLSERRPAEPREEP